MQIGKRLKAPDGRTGKLVFISPVNGRYYLEFNRTLPWITFSHSQLFSRHDLFAPIHDCHG